MQWTANPPSPVRFRPRPPFTITVYIIDLISLVTACMKSLAINSKTYIRIISCAAVLIVASAIVYTGTDAHAQMAESTETRSAITFNNPLVDAADRGDEDELIKLIKQGNPIDGRGDFGVTPLMRASFRGHTRIVQILVGLGANIDAVDVGGASALHIASRLGQAEVVNLLVKGDAAIDSPDAEGWTPLMRGAAAKNPEIVTTLLQHGASVQKVNKAGENAMIYAARTGNQAVVSIFAENGALQLLSHQERRTLYNMSVRRKNNEVAAMLRGTDNETVVSSNPASQAASVSSPSSASPSPVSTAVIPAVIPQVQDKTTNAVKEKKAANVTANPQNKVVASPTNNKNLVSILFSPFRQIKNAITAKPSEVPATAPAKAPINILPPAEVAPAQNLSAAPPKAQQAPIIHTTGIKREAIIVKPLAPIAPQPAPIAPKAVVPVILQPQANASPTVANAPETATKLTDAKKPQITVAEAIRVPLSETKTPMKPATEFLPSNSSDLKKTLWVQVGEFASEQETTRYLNRVYNHPKLQRLRARVISPAGNNKSFYLRMGPVNEGEEALSVCEALSQKEYSCTFEQDAGKSFTLSKSTAEISMVNKKANSHKSQYWVQFGSFNNERAAERLQANLKATSKLGINKLDFYISSPKHASSELPKFRLRAGPFESYEAASAKCSSISLSKISCIAVKD
jgi:uncharacterized protein